MASPPNTYVSISSSALCVYYPAMCSVLVSLLSLLCSYVSTYPSHFSVHCHFHCYWTIWLLFLPLLLLTCCLLYTYFDICSEELILWTSIIQTQNNCTVTTGICSIRVIEQSLVYKWVGVSFCILFSYTVYEHPSHNSRNIWTLQ